MDGWTRPRLRQHFHPRARPEEGRRGRDGGSARFWPLWASRRVEALKAEMHICMFVSYLVFYFTRSSIFQDVQPTAGLPTVCLLQERFRVVQMLTSFHFSTASRKALRGKKHQKKPDTALCLKSAAEKKCFLINSAFLEGNQKC